MKIIQICMIISALHNYIHARVVPTQTNYKSLIGNAFLNGYGVLEDNIVMAINNLEESSSSIPAEESPNTSKSEEMVTESEILIIPKSTIGINNIFTREILLQQLRNKTKDNVTIISKPKQIHPSRYQKIDTEVKKETIAHEKQYTHNQNVDGKNNNNGQLGLNLFSQYTNNHNGNRNNVTGVIGVWRDKENSYGIIKTQGSITGNQAVIQSTNNQHLPVRNIYNTFTNILSQNQTQITNKRPLGNYQNQVYLNRAFHPNSTNINKQTTNVSTKKQNFASINNKNEMRNPRGQNYNQIINNPNSGSETNFGITRVRSYIQNGNNQIVHSPVNSRVRTAYQNIRNQNFANALATNRQIAAARSHAHSRTHNNVPVTRKPFVIFA